MADHRARGHRFNIGPESDPRLRTRGIKDFTPRYGTPTVADALSANPDGVAPPLVPEWFKDTMPPFLSESEREVEYRRYLATIEEDQFHGILVGGLEQVILRENPGTSWPHERRDQYAWGGRQDNEHPSLGMKNLAGWMLRTVLGGDEPDENIRDAFAALIVGRLPAAEWRLTDAFIYQWYTIYKENS
jgi:hypothetical protein